MKSGYALEWIDLLISVTLAKEEADWSHLTPDYVETLKQRAAKEKEGIRMMLMRQIFNAREERVLEILIQQYQSSLVRLLDQLDKNKLLLPSLPHMKSLLEELTIVLEDLLAFIELHFTKYYNLDQAVPCTYLRINKKDWKGRLKKVDPDLKKLNNSLSSLLLKVMGSFVNASELTYRQMIYYKDLFSEVSGVFNSTSTDDYLFGRLEDSLIYLNFNHSFFIALLIRKIDDEINVLKNQEDIIEHLISYRNRIENLPVKPGACYNISLPAVTESLLRWISFHVNKPIFKLSNDSIQSMEKKQVNDDKVNLSVSVAMLGLFIRLLTEEEIITTKNQADLIRFFASNFTTPKQDKISSDSLYGSYFKPLPGTIRMMNDCLSRIQHLLNKNF